MDSKKLVERVSLLNDKLPVEYSAGRWLLCMEQGQHRIKRCVLRPDKTQTFQRLPVGLFRHLDYDGLLKLITSLNYELDYDVRNKFKAHSPFLPDKYLEGFYRQLEIEIPTPEVVRHNYSHLRKYCLNFFLKKSLNPLDWKKNWEVDWCDYLLSLKLSPRTLRSIIQIINRFMKYLNKKDPDTYAPMVFEPITKAMFRKYSSDWVENEKKKFRQYVTHEEYERIMSVIPKELSPIFQICYSFGLRRREALGLYDNLEAVRKDYLFITRQLKRYTIAHGAEYDRTKNRTSRKVNYWFSTPSEAYSLIKSIVPLDPHKYSKLYTAFAKAAGVTITLHDLRHTFITNAVNDKNLGINDVRLAVGHSDLSITSKYLKDSRGFDETIWVPGV